MTQEKQREEGTGSLQQPVYKRAGYPRGGFLSFIANSLGAFSLNPNSLQCARRQPKRESFEITEAGAIVNSYKTRRVN